MTFFIIAIMAGLLWVSYLMNHIPSTGRDGQAKGEVITAVITNKPKAADRSAVLRAAANGQRFKVKMKPTEAHLWIKGDSIRIILAENKKSYRILFSEYFHENEDRLQDYAKELLEKKVSTKFIAACLVQYKKEDMEAIKKSKLESQRIFTFVSYMRMLDVCSMLTILSAALFLFWCVVKNPKFGSMLVPLLAILILVWMLYNTVQMCKGIIKQSKQ